MRILALAIVACMVLVSGALLAPMNYYVTERHALAHWALASGWASGAAALLSPLAHISDARALNNLGVLHAPRLHLQTRPTLEIASTAATLDGLKFFDADRQLNAANGAARGSP